MRKRVFFKNLAPSLFFPYHPLTSCKKSEKTNEPILRKVCDEQTDTQTSHEVNISLDTGHTSSDISIHMECD